MSGPGRSGAELLSGPIPNVPLCLPGPRGNQAIGTARVCAASSFSGAILRGVRFLNVGSLRMTQAVDWMLNASRSIAHRTLAQATVYFRLGRANQFEKDDDGHHGSAARGEDGRHIRGDRDRDHRRAGQPWDNPPAEPRDFRRGSVEPQGAARPVGQSGDSGTQPCARLRRGSGRLLGTRRTDLTHSFSFLIWSIALCFGR